MKWWNDFWLNEGFASYISYLAVNNTTPTWNFVCYFNFNISFDSFLFIDATFCYKRVDHCY